jgi:hypothetical protein
LYSLLLLPFSLGSVTRFDHAPLRVAPSQKPAGGFPAQASSRSLSPHRIEWDQGARPWERIPRFAAAGALPRETAPLAAAIQPIEGQLPDGVVKARRGPAVVRHAKVVEVAAHLARDCLPEVGQLVRMALLAQPLVHGHQGSAQPLLRGLALYSRQPSAADFPVVGEAEEIQRGRALFRFTRAARRPACRMAPAAFSGR